jgi:hypothetical protein
LLGSKSTQPVGVLRRTTANEADPRKLLPIGLADVEQESRAEASD